MNFGDLDIGTKNKGYLKLMNMKIKDRNHLINNKNKNQNPVPICKKNKIYKITVDYFFFKLGQSNLKPNVFPTDCPTW